MTKFENKLKQEFQKGFEAAKSQAERICSKCEDERGILICLDCVELERKVLRKEFKEMIEKMFKPELKDNFVSYPTLVKIKELLQKLNSEKL